MAEVGPVGFPFLFPGVTVVRLGVVVLTCKPALKHSQTVSLGATQGECLFFSPDLTLVCGRVSIARLSAFT